MVSILQDVTFGGDIVTLQEVKAIAKTNGMRIRNMKKENIIRILQRVEGNSSCFATDLAKECGQESCLWRHDCLEHAEFQH